MTTAQLQQDEGTAATVGALLDSRVRSLALLLLAASFLAGFAVGKFALWRDRAGHEHGMAYKTLKLPADKAGWAWAEFMEPACPQP